MSMINKEFSTKEMEQSKINGDWEKLESISIIYKEYH